MADPEMSGTDAAQQPTPQPAPQAGPRGHADDDLIDYDSDDVSLKIPDSKPRLLGIGDKSSEAEPAVGDASISAQATNGVDPLSGAAGETVVKDSGPAATSVHGPPYEIDYEDFDFGANDSGDGQQKPAAAHVQRQGSNDDNSMRTSGADNEAETKNYEIDWEDDDVVNESSPHDTKSQDDADADAMVVNDPSYAISNQAPETGKPGLDPADEPAAASSEPEPFTAITVHYRGEDYPFFSLSYDGFFSDVSILDKPMGAVLRGLRAELGDEIGPQDDLIFQVDKLGLEFSESSSDDSQTSITMRQILEVLDILVKNQDPESARTLYTYLFTRPNAARRFEFLIECAAVKNQGLAEVMYLFPRPFSGSVRGGSTAADDYDEQPGSYEDNDDGDTAPEDHEHVDDYEGIAGESATYDNEGHVGDYEGDGDHDGVNHGQNLVDYDDSHDKQAAANDGDCPVSASAEPAVSRGEDFIDYSAGDNTDAIDNVAPTGNPKSFEAGRTAEHDWIDYGFGDKMAADTHEGNAHGSGNTGGGRAVDADNGSGLIDYEGAGKEIDSAQQRAEANRQAAQSKEGEQGHGDGVDGLGSHRAGHEDGLVDYSDDKMAAADSAPKFAKGDEDLIDHSDDKLAAIDNAPKVGKGDENFIDCSGDLTATADKVAKYGNNNEFIDYSDDKIAAPSYVAKLAKKNEDLIDYSDDEIAVASKVFKHGDDDLIDYSDDKIAAPGSPLKYDKNDDVLIDYSDDKLEAVSYNAVNSKEVKSVQGGAAGDQVASGQGQAASRVGGNTATNDLVEEPWNSHLQVGAYHSRGVSEISIAFSAAEADGPMPARAESSTNPLLNINLDEPGEEEGTSWEDTQASAGHDGAGGGIATTAVADGSSTATLGDNGDAASSPGNVALDLNPSADQDELVEIDWDVDAVPATSGNGGGATYGQSCSALKRAYPSGLNKEAGNDVKRRRP